MSNQGCTEENQHRARQSAQTEIEMWLADYAADNHLSNFDLLLALGSVSYALLREADRDDEERRTGFKHRLAGE